MFFSVIKACLLMSQLLESHWSVVKCIRHFLNGTSHRGLLISQVESVHKFHLKAYNDSDWPSDPDYRRSKSGLCVYQGPNLILWISKKQSLVVRSSAENEYQALAHNKDELLWI